VLVGVFELSEFRTRVLCGQASPISVIEVSRGLSNIALSYPRPYRRTGSFGYPSAGFVSAKVKGFFKYLILYSYKI
jgi:hypothetical protein